jgi:hypothetical protein
MQSTYNMYFWVPPAAERHCANTLHSLSLAHCYRVRANVATKKQSATQRASILPFRRTRLHNLLRQKGLERFAPADASVCIPRVNTLAKQQKRINSSNTMGEPFVRARSPLSRALYLGERERVERTKIVPFLGTLFLFLCRHYRYTVLNESNQSAKETFCTNKLKASTEFLVSIKFFFRIYNFQTKNY